MITIRRANPDEIQKLQDLNDDAFANNPQLDPDLKLDWAQSDTGKNYFTDTIANPKNILLVAEDQGMLVGYIAGSPKHYGHRRSRYIELDNLGVAQTYRRRGIASQLIEKFLEWAEEQGFQKVYLSSYFKNSQAITFYKEMGFSEIDLGMERTI
jgi:ribosomal protein S18 acetylase RimI-like enzyme